MICKCNLWSNVQLIIYNEEQVMKNKI